MRKTWWNAALKVLPTTSASRRRDRAIGGPCTPVPLSSEEHLAIQASVPRAFIVWRYEDVIGISGEKMKVAEGVLFSSGWVITHWLPTNVRNQPKTEVWYHKGTDPFLEISGHDGRTVVLFLDEDAASTSA